MCSKLIYLIYLSLLLGFLPDLDFLLLLKPLLHVLTHVWMLPMKSNNMFLFLLLNWSWHYILIGMCHVSLGVRWKELFLPQKLHMWPKNSMIWVALKSPLVIQLGLLRLVMSSTAFYFLIHLRCLFRMYGKIITFVWLWNFNLN